ncbi:alpha/beta hydrolase [Patescibacteria group bacterium]
MQEKVFVKNKKGLRLATVIERPKFKGEFPTVFLFHGFKGYKEEAQYSKLAKELLKNRIASVRFDASGFGESGGDFRKDYRLTNYIKDAFVIYEYVIQKDWVDKKRIGMMGHSLGAAVVLVIASKYPQIKAVVSVSTPDIFATRDDLGKRLKEWMAKGYIEVGSSKAGKNLKVPYKFALDAMKYDIRKYAGKISSQKLFILGKEDTRVVPDQTRNVYKAAEEPKKLIEVENMRHDYKRQPKILKKVNKEIVEYFNKNI